MARNRPARAELALPAPSLAQNLSRVLEPGLTPVERARALRDLARAVGPAVARPRGLTDVVTRIAPLVTPRTVDELREAHPDLTETELAAELVSSAARLTAAIGAAGGAVAALSETAGPLAVVSAPVQMGVESLAVVAVELRLAVEVHLALGVPVPTAPMPRAAFALRVWTTGRGLTLPGETVAEQGVGALLGGPGAAQLLSRAARSQLSDRLLRRFVRSSLGFLPLLAGAAAGAAVNARSTRRFGERLIESLPPAGIGR